MIYKVIRFIKALKDKHSKAQIKIQGIRGKKGSCTVVSTKGKAFVALGKSLRQYGL